MLKETDAILKEIESGTDSEDLSGSEPETDSESDTGSRNDFESRTVSFSEPNPANVPTDDGVCTATLLFNPSLQCVLIATHNLLATPPFAHGCIHLYAL